MHSVPEWLLCANLPVITLLALSEPRRQQPIWRTCSRIMVCLLVVVNGWYLATLVAGCGCFST